MSHFRVRRFVSCSLAESVGTQFLLPWIATVMVVFLPLLLPAQPYDGLVVFGDSGSDTGNRALFSNGTNWIQQFADAVYIPRPVPSERRGFNYAFGGARTGFGIDTIFGPTPTIGRQIETYLETNSPGDETLFVIRAGANDMATGRAPTDAIANLSNHLTSLAEAGARHFLVPNLTPGGAAPGFADWQSEFISPATQEFNELLTHEMNLLETQHDVEIIRVDFFKAIQSALDDPSSFGLSNVTDPLDGRQTPANTDEYLYWDDFHFTTAGHAILAEQAVMALPPLGTERPLIHAGENWNFHPGTAEPSPLPELGWTTPEYDDSAWESGEEGFGFGRHINDREDVRTVLESMEGRATTLYIRHAFAVADEDVASGLILRAAYNDAFVAYVNGVEVARANVSQAGPLPFDATADGRAPSGYGVHFIDLERIPDLLQEGSENTLAIQALNRSVRDRDFLLSQIELSALLPIGGDANADGQVNLADFTILSSNFNVAGNWAAGDFDLNSQVSFADFVILADNFGAMTNPGISRTATVPEPSMWTMALACIIVRHRTRSGRHHLLRRLSRRSSGSPLVNLRK